MPHGTFLVSDRCFPQTIAVLRSRAEPLGIELEIGPSDEMKFDAPDVFGALVQYPDEAGSLDDLKPFIDKAHAADVKVAVATDLLALALATSPGEAGADVVFGNSQRFGVPLGFGGPHAAFFATSQEFVRHMPGRVIGVSIDAHGHRAYRMSLQTREQHIRREKATSNICTAQALLANMAAMYAVYHGPEGIKAIATRVHAMTRALDGALKSLGYEQRNAQLLRHAAHRRGRADRVTAIRAAADGRRLQLPLRRRHRDRHLARRDRHDRRPRRRCRHLRDQRQQGRRRRGARFKRAAGRSGRRR